MSFETEYSREVLDKPTITPEERKAIQNYFEENLETLVIPGKVPCQGYIQSCSSRLEWKQVKDVVYSAIQTERRKNKRKTTAGFRENGKKKQKK